MYQIDFSKPVKVHFIGIGGISMSGLAAVLMNAGFKVSGSDSHESELTVKLALEGADIMYGQRRDNIKADVDVVVYTAAVHPDNPEYMEAVERGIPMLSRAELLGEMMVNYKTAIAVSGTHGKTTTTSMLSEILIGADVDPTISVGGILPSIGGNIRIGNSDCFVTEACEYTNSFLSFFPTVEIILNIGEDHLDFFKDIDDIRHSFRRFAEKLDEKGVLVINGDIERYDELTKDLVCKVVTFSVTDKDCDYYVDNVSYDSLARATFTLCEGDKEVFTVSLNVPGEHNVADAVAAAVAALMCGVASEDVKRGLESYKGVNRRFQYKGEVGGLMIVDDYAHHPDEIKATLTAAKKTGASKVWCVFQPHTYTRTKALMQEFADALCLADEVILAKIYPARETDTLGVSSADLALEIEKRGKKAVYFESFDDIENFVLQNCIHGEMLITMGAGDIVKLGESLLGI